MKRQQRSHLITVIASALFMVFVLIGVMFFSGFWTTASTYDVSAYVSNARGIAQYSTVFEAGLPVGLVTGVQRNGPDAILKLRLTSGIRPLPVDTKLQLGLRSVAGEADVLLSPGTSRSTIRDNGSLGLSQNEDYTEVDQILNALQGKTTPNTQKFFQAAGLGLDGEGQNLNNVLGNAGALINDSPPLTTALSSQRQQVADIVQNFGTIMSAIGQRDAALREFAEGSLTTFNAVAARDVALSKGLGQIGFAFTAIRRATKSIGVTGPTITPVVQRLASAATTLDPTIDVLQPAARQGVKLISALGAASPPLKHILVSLTALQPSANEAFPAMHAALCQIEPIARYIQPYGPDFSAFFQNFGGALDTYGQSSHILIANPVVDPTHLFRGIDSAPVSSALNTLITTGIFGKVGADTGFNPQPGPGHMNQHTNGIGITGATAWAAAHPGDYPIVSQDCPVPKNDQTSATSINP